MRFGWCLGIRSRWIPYTNNFTLVQKLMKIFFAFLNQYQHISFIRGGERDLDAVIMLRQKLPLHKLRPTVLFRRIRSLSRVNPSSGCTLESLL